MHVNFFELAATISPVLKLRGGAKGGVTLGTLQFERGFLHFNLALEVTKFTEHSDQVAGVNLSQSHELTQWLIESFDFSLPGTVASKW